MMDHGQQSDFLVTFSPTTAKFYEDADFLVVEQQEECQPWQLKMVGMLRRR
jgi:hypothetical protein